MPKTAIFGSGRGLCDNAAMNRLLYTLLLWLLLPFVPVKLSWRGLRQPEYLRHVGERFGFYSLPLTPHALPVIWLHCVSVGETRAAVPLVKALQQQYPDKRILLTHGTPTGRATSEQLFGDSVLRCYLPYDLPFAVKRFLRFYQPNIGLLMETELWFNLIRACNRYEIPLLLVNARLSEKSARGYAMLGKLTQQGLAGLAAIAAQTDNDAARLEALGADNVQVTGNLKFDAAAPEPMNLGLRRLFGEARPVFLAASTREGEESMILDALASARIPDLLTIIVPRHPQRFDEVAALLEKRGIAYVRRSSLKPGEDKETDSVISSVVRPDVLLGDSMGEMMGYYSMCDITLIGGSLLPLGGQNLIEACALGKPVLVGPHTFNFAEAARKAIGAGAALRINSADELGATLHNLLDSPATLKRMGEAGQHFYAENRGSTERVMALVAQFI